MSNTISVKETRIVQAQQVLLSLFIDPKLTVKAACSKVKISPRQYYYWLANGEDAIQATRTLIENQQRQMISELAIAKSKILGIMLKEATNELTEVSERISLYKVIAEELDQLQNIYNVRPGIEQSAQAFLKRGPQIETKKSRFATIEVEQTETGFKIGLDKEQEILDLPAE